MGIREWVDKLLSSSATDEAATDAGGGWRDAESYSGAKTFRGDVSDTDRNFLSHYEPPVHWIVTRVANDIYDDWFTVVDVGNEDDKTLDDAVQKILTKLNAKRVLTRLTIFERRYGTSLLLLAYSTRGDDKWNNPISEGQEVQLEQMIPYPWTKVTVDDVEKDKASLNYGYPKMYKVSRMEAGGTSVNPLMVDYTRTIRMATRLDEHLWKGNSIVDIIADDALGYRRIRGGMYKLWVRYGSGFPEIKMPKATNDQLKEFKAQGYFKNIFEQAYFLSGKGGESIDFKGAAGVALNPEPFDNISMRALSMGTGIPADIMRGTQAGALSGSQVDERQYFKRITSEQSLVNPTVRAIIDILIRTGQVIFEGEYKISWNSIFEINDLDKAKIEVMESIANERKLKWMTVNELRESLDLGKFPEEDA